MNDPFDLRRFVDAQQSTFESALREIKAGRKQGHWMWFIFPQLRGLGHSHMATHYGLASRDEAAAYLRHAILGPRLLQITDAVNAVEGSTAHDIFGSPDDIKFRSCMTLFAEAAPDQPSFRRALTRYFEGQPDPATLGIIAEHAR